MNMIKKGLVIAGAAALTATGANAADATIGLDFASSYVFRGVTFNDDVVVQPYLEVEGFEIAGKAITIGTWASYDFEDNGSGSGEFAEVDFYAGMTLGAGFDIGYCQYTYPGLEGDADKEISLSYGYDATDALSLSVAAYYGLSGAINEDFYYEAGAEYGIDISDAMSASVGATIGYTDDGQGEDGFSNYSFTAGTAYALTETTELSASLTYVGDFEEQVVETDKEFFAKVGVSHSF